MCSQYCESIHPIDGATYSTMLEHNFGVDQQAATDVPVHVLELQNILNLDNLEIYNSHVKLFINIQYNKYSNSIDIKSIRLIQNGIAKTNLTSENIRLDTGQLSSIDFLTLQGEENRSPQAKKQSLQHGKNMN